MVVLVVSYRAGVEDVPWAVGLMGCLFLCLEYSTAVEEAPKGMRSETALWALLEVLAEPDLVVLLLDVLALRHSPLSRPRYSRLLLVLALNLLPCLEKLRHLLPSHPFVLVHSLCHLYSSLRRPRPSESLAPEAHLRPSVLPQLAPAACVR